MTDILVDTNVLVYAYDRTAGEKQLRAFEVLDGLARSGRGVLTAQIMAEFFVVVTGKIKEPLNPAEAYERLSNYHLAWPILDLTPMIVLEAVRGVRDYKMNYWDSQIWAAARLNQVGVIFSGDFNNGTVMEGVRFINPFAPAFSISNWIA